MTILRVIDIETTGLALPAEIIELGRVDLVGTGKYEGWQLQLPPTSILYRPLHGIPPETMAVHHITPADVAQAPVCTPEDLKHMIFSGDRPDVMVAHNCAFERSFIPDHVTDSLPWICTQKCALRLWPEAPGHSNQVLRYWREHAHDPEFAMPPHRAAPDAFVTAHLVWDMLDEVSVEQLIAWTTEPKLLLRVPFGKHRNALWADVPVDYLAWMTRQADMDSDVIWNAHQEMGRR
jgi:exodeoxyribonuclease X